MKRFQLLSLVVLYFAVIILSIQVISNRHEARQLFIQLQKLEKERDRLSTDWSRLKLEQSAQLNQVRIEQKATRQLSMRKPPAGSIRIIRE